MDTENISSHIHMSQNSIIFSNTKPAFLSVLIIMLKKGENAFQFRPYTRQSSLLLFIMIQGF